MRWMTALPPRTMTESRSDEWAMMERLAGIGSLNHRDPLNPEGKCFGPEFKGCPDNNKALPTKYGPQGVTTVYYHCAKCLPEYVARYPYP